MANYINTVTGAIVTECQLYDSLICGCSYKYFAPFKWENDVTHVIHTGREWKAIWALNPPICPPIACADPNCPNGRELAFLNLISSVTMGGMSSQFAQLTLNSATFIDNESLVPPIPVYTVDWGDGSPIEPIIIGVMKSHAPLIDGNLKGRIYWQGANFEFWYQVSFGLLTQVQTTRVTTVNYDLDCALYPEYTVGITDAGNISGNTIESRDGYVLGDSVYSFGAAGKSFSENGQLLTDLTTLNEEIIASYQVKFSTTDIQSMDNTSVFRTKCID